MAQPKLTYYTGLVDDGEDASGWTVGGTGSATVTSVKDEFLDFNVTNVGAGMSITKYPSTQANTNTHDKILARFKCSNSSIRFELYVGYTSKPGETVIATQNSETLVTKAGDLTSATYVNFLRVTATGGSGHIYIDFIIITEGQWEIPHVSGGVLPSFEKQIGKMGIPLRWGERHQQLGMKSPTIVIRGDIEQGESGWKSSSGPTLEYLMRAFYRDDWCWYSYDEMGHGFKVIVEYIRHPRTGDGEAITQQFEIGLIVTARCSLDDSIYGDPGWLGYGSD